jgi:hypothetical protein
VTQFENDLIELYQGEILGEALFSAMLASAENDDQRLKLGSMLQLETETKARLRPALISIGLSIEEDPAMREQALATASALADASWIEKMTTLNHELKTTFVPRFAEIAAHAHTVGNQSHAELADSMVVHEAALLELTRRELNGEADSSVEPVAMLLTYPLTAPIAKG